MLCNKRRRQPREGALLLVVLIVVAMLSIANLTYFDWTFTERRAANAVTRSAQARAAAESGAEYVRAYLLLGTATIDQDGGWYENPKRFQGVVIQDSPSAELRLRATMLAPRLEAGRRAGARHGLEDESGRLNLNMLLVAEAREEDAGRNMLLALPGMTESIADAILDWLDDDDTPRTLGAEVEYYAAQDPPYSPANGPIATIDQLLQVRGVTAELLYGPDQDLSYSVNPNEFETYEEPEVDNADGALDGGWAALLTLRSAELNLRQDGTAKINVNTDDLEQLHADVEAALGRDAANYLIAYRQGGPEESGQEDDGSGNGGPGGGSDNGDDGPDIPSPTTDVKDASEITIDFSQPGATQLNSVLELIGGRARVVEQDQVSGETLVESPYSDDPGAIASFVTELMDTLTTTDAESIPGRLNVNQAARPLLEGVPGMPLASVEGILANQDPSAGGTRPDRMTAAWLLAEGYVGLEAMLAIEPYVCGRGDVYRTQVVGAFDSGGPFCRLEVVVDASVSPPKIVGRRDLTPLGIGHAQEVLSSESQN